MKFSAVAAMLMLASMSTFACEEIFGRHDELSRKLESYVQGGEVISKVDFDVISQECKTWSQKPNLSILVKPYEYVDSAGGHDEKRLGMVVAVIDNRSGSIVDALNEREMMVVDAIEPRGVRVDTANYKLDDSKFAFGVRVLVGNRSTANSFSEEVMSMYTLDSGALKKIVNGLLMGSSSTEGGGGCAYSGLDSKTYVSVGKRGSNGYVDLFAKTKTVKSVSFEKNGVCKRVSERDVERRYILQFDGKIYQIPNFLMAKSN